MPDEYWVARGDAIRGPYPESRIRSALGSGKLLPTDMVSVDSPSGPWAPLPTLFPDKRSRQGDAPALQGGVEGLPPPFPTATSEGPPPRDAATLFAGDLPPVGGCSLPGSSKPSPTAPAANFWPDTSAPLESLRTWTEELKASNQSWLDVLKAAWTADAAPRLPELLRPLVSLNLTFIMAALTVAGCFVVGFYQGSAGSVSKEQMLQVREGMSPSEGRLILGNPVAVADFRTDPELRAALIQRGGQLAKVFRDTAHLQFLTYYYFLESESWEVVFNNDHLMKKNASEKSTDAVSWAAHVTKARARHLDP